MQTIIDGEIFEIYYINIKCGLKIKYAENYNIIVTFLHQPDKFIRTRVVTGQKIFNWSDDIKPNDDITPFDGT